jgi:hypothetical protein
METTSHYISRRVRPDCFHYGHQLLGGMASGWQGENPKGYKNGNAGDCECE